MIRYSPNINEGLNTKQVQYRIKNNHINVMPSMKTDSLIKIILINIFTMFNFLNIYISVLYMVSNSYKWIFFISVFIINTFLNLYRDIKIKESIDKVYIKNIKNSVIRDSKNIIISSDKIVLDDIINYNNHSIITTDSVILEGSVLVDERNLSGIDSYSVKDEGCILYAGSKIINGKCIARADRVGSNNYLSKIITHKKRYPSVIKKLMNNIIKFVSIAVIIISIIIYIQTKSINTIANTISFIIPVGMVLISSLIYTIVMLKLNKNKVLIKDISSLENMAHVDTICLDKTGTITTNDYVLEKVEVLNKKYDYKDILNAIASNCNKNNNIIKALSNKYNKKTDYEFISEEETKEYIKIVFKKHTFYLVKEKDNNYIKVVLKEDNKNIVNLLFSAELKDNIKRLISNLDKDIKIITGDNIQNTEYILKKIGIKKIKNIDMSLNITNMNHHIVKDYNVFTNVSPDQKRILINALKNNGHKVVMVGDGVNDLLGMCESDSSISFLSGSLENNIVSDYIIVDNKLDGINKIMDISEHSTCNILKITYLYLIKTIYSYLLIIIFYIMNINYVERFNTIYGLFPLIPSILIMFSKDKEINVDLNKSILVSLIAFLITFIGLLFNINILYLILICEILILLRYKFLNKILIMILIIILFGCMIIL